MRNRTALIDHKYRWQSDAIPRARFRYAGIDQAKSSNYIRVRVCKQSVGNTFISRKLLMNIHAVFYDERDVIAELLKFLMFCIPGDRLAFAVRSPIQ